MIGHKSRFVQVTRGFYAPDLAAQHKAKIERMDKERSRKEGTDRAGSSQLSGQDKSLDVNSIINAA